MRDIYAQKALAQIPRLLSLQDRNPFSQTYGCCNREYWLCRSTDFPSSIAQFGIHALALAWRHQMPGNIYYQHPKILAWTLAGVEYWMKIQKRDGSFDEFYPNERGWAGPTGFLLYAMTNTYQELGEAFPARLQDQFIESCERAARYLIRWDEPGVLANHHAMAALPVFEAARLIDSTQLWDGYRAKIEEFYTYCDPEGWCLEYDGADPGYLSATVSFLSKIYRHREISDFVRSDSQMKTVMERAIEFCSYFAYPNGHYAGTLGSRQTLHFYPHGFELLASEIPLAAAVADRMLKGLQSAALVPPEIQEDRYCPYRVPEFLLSWIDYTDRSQLDLAQLPDTCEPFDRIFDRAKFYFKKTHSTYVAINLSKGGVIKYFNLKNNKLAFNDCGILAKLSDGRLVTSQWIGPEYEIGFLPSELSVKGKAHVIPQKIFTPLKFILFRIVMLMIGWNAWTAYKLKGLVRSLLMTHAATVPMHFERKICIHDDETLTVVDKIELKSSKIMVRKLLIGDELPVRYVPQSRYFQPQELDVEGWLASNKQIHQLNTRRSIVIYRTFDIAKSCASVKIE